MALYNIQFRNTVEYCTEEAYATLESIGPITCPGITFTFGHLVGDKFLLQFASIILENFAFEIGHKTASFGVTFFQCK